MENWIDVCILFVQILAENHIKVNEVIYRHLEMLPCSDVRASNHKAWHALESSFIWFDKTC